MFLLIAGAMMISMVAYVMFMPVKILVDTDKDVYKVLQPGVFSFRVVSGRELSMELRIAGIRIPLSAKRNKAEQETKNIKVKKRSRVKLHSASAWRFLIDRIIHSFKVHRLDLNIDTNDVVLNAHLFPILYFASNVKHSMKINFVGQNYFGLRGSVRPISLVWSFILFETKQ